MHEVALSMQLARIVTKAAANRKVLVVRLEIGALRQVVPDTLAHAWRFVVKGTELGQSRLDVTWRPVVLRCPAGHVTEMSEHWGFDCDICGAPARVVGGEEFRVLDIECERTGSGHARERA